MNFESYFIQIHHLVTNLSKKNNKQTLNEINEIINKIGYPARIQYLKELILSITQEKEIKKSYKIKMLETEIHYILHNENVLLARKELMSLKIPIQQIKQLDLSPSEEYLFGVDPSSSSQLSSSSLLFDYIVNNSDEKTNGENESSSLIFTPSWKTSMNVNMNISEKYLIPENVIIELGSKCSENKETFSSVISNVYGNEMSSKQVYDLIIAIMKHIEMNDQNAVSNGMINNNQVNNNNVNSLNNVNNTNNNSIINGWDSQIIGTLLKTKCKEWNQLAEYIDKQNYECKSYESVLFLVKLFQSIGEFPIHTFFKEQWNNGRAQGSFVQKLLNVASQSSSESQFLMKQICWLFNVGTERGIGMIWKQQPFIERIIEIGEHASVEFDSIYFNIETVLPLLCRCKPTHARQKAIMVVLKSNLKQVSVIQNHWKMNKQIIAQGLRDIYIENPTQLEEIITIVGNEEAIKTFCQMKPTYFALDIVCLLQKTDPSFGLEKWLTEQKKIKGKLFGKEILTFIKDKQLGNRMVSAYKLETPIVKQLLTIASACGWKQEANEIEDQFFTKIIQKDTNLQKANEMFAKYFGNKESVETFVDQIIILKESKDPNKNDLFALLIKTLFDEFTRIKEFTKSDYAVQFGKLCGEIIQKGVLRNCPLIYLLKVILYAVNEPPRSNYYLCGINALQRFKNRLKEWPTYCYLLKDKKNIELNDTMLYRIIVENANDKLPLIMNLLKKLMSMSQLSSMLDSRNTSIIKALTNRLENIDKMTAEMVTKEIQEVFDQLNAQQQDGELLIEMIFFVISLLHEDKQLHILQLKKKIRPNFNQLLTFTIQSIIILLRLREYDRQNALLFESLGSLLGLLTIGRNKPLLSKHLSLKSFLTDHISNDNNDVMIQFVIKFLMASVHSIVFTPNNPWMIPLLQILATLHSSPDLLLQQDSIQSLFDAIKISPKKYIEQHPPRDHIIHISMKIAKLTRDRNMGDENIFRDYIEKQLTIPVEKLKKVIKTDKQLIYTEKLTQYALPTIPEYLICSSLPTINWNIIILYCLDFALQDISKTTAVSLNTIITTVTQLVQKDFAMETDMEKIKVAVNRVTSIAQKLSHYTCRSCLDTKFWKYIHPFVDIALKQKEIMKPTEQMKDVVMNTFQSLIEIAVDIKLKELNTNAEKQIELFLSRIEKERNQAKENKSTDFIAKGFEYLKDAPELPPELQIAPGGVTDYQMEMYGIGVPKEVKEHMDDKCVELIHEPIQFEVIEKYTKLMTMEMIEKIIKKTIDECVKTQNEDYCLRTIQIFGMIFLQFKSNHTLCNSILSNIFTIQYQSFIEHYQTDSFNPQIYYSLTSYLLELCVEKTMNTVERSRLINQTIIFFGKIHPSQYPKFICQWLQLFSHRCFINELRKPSKEKTVFVTRYFELFIHYMKFIKTILFIDTPITKEIYNATLSCIILLRNCFPTYVYLLAYPLVASIPYEFLSLRLPILTSLPPDEIQESLTPLLETIPKEYLPILEKKEKDELFKLMEKDLSSLCIVVYLYQNNGMNLLTEMILNGNKLQRLLLINAIGDLMRIQNRTTERMREYLAIVIEKKNIEVNELILTVLLQRSFGQYIQSGALKSLVELVKTYPLLNEIAKKKSMNVAKLLSDLC